MSGPARLTVAAALRQAVATLRAAGVPDAAGDARRLMADALGVAPGRLILMETDALPEAAAVRFGLAVTARAARQPVAQILGRRAFWGRDFRVTRDVLDPRPETETLVAAALARPFSRILDLGTGSGCILLTLLAERPAARGTGTDLSAAALAVAADNAARLGLADRARWLQGDWYDALPQREGGFDLIVSNPPYIAAAELAALAPEVRLWEPALALSPGGDGLRAYRAIAAGAAARLSPEGALLVEIGPTQAPAVASLMQAAGLAAPRLHCDLDGRPRVLETARA